MNHFEKSNHPLKQELQTTIELAHQAGELIQQIRSKGYTIHDKGGNLGLVTEADRASSQFLLHELEKQFTSDLFISEEEPLPIHSGQPERIWFIDPIDGTNEFITGSQEWSIMIGLAIQGRPHLGVVYQPDTGYTYYAVKDGGAFLRIYQRSRVLKIREVIEPKDAILTQSRSHWSSKADHIAKQLGIKKILKQGSLGLKLGQIADKKADLYFNFSGRCHLWDLCAPEAILEEAGGVVLPAFADKIVYNLGETLVKESFLASNKLLATKVHHFLE